MGGEEWATSPTILRRSHTGIAYAADGEVVLGLVALIVAENISKVIGALLVEVDDAVGEVGMQYGQSHAGFTVRLHIPDMGAAPVVVVAPLVDLGLAADGDAGDVGAEHAAPIHQQACFTNAVVVVGGLAVVVGPQGKANPAPCGKVARQGPHGVLLLRVGLSEAEGLFAGATVEYALASLRNGHKGMGLRSNGVSNERCQLLHRVAHDPGLGVVQFQVQVGTGAVTGIAAKGNEVAGLHGQLVRGIVEIEGVAIAGALEELFVGFGKALQMTVDAGQSVRVADVDGVAEAVLIDGDAADVAVGNGEYLLALLVIGLDVESAVEVPGPRLAEVACQHNVVVDRRVVFHAMITDRLGIIATACQQYQAACYKITFNFQFSIINYFSML